MKLDFIGRVENTILPRSKALLPVFEAVVNALHAIEEVKIDSGSISIIIHRDTTQLAISPDIHVIAPVVAVDIIDNGIGFTRANYESFETSDTRYKASKGAKGVGRLLWLKAFEYVTIKSVFEEDGEWFCRKFNFSLQDGGITKHDLEPLHFKATRETRVTLHGFHNEYQKHCPKSLETISFRILEHTLTWFLYQKQFHIQVSDEIDSIDLTKLFADQIQSTSKRHHFSIHEQEFTIDHLRLYSGETTTHQIHFCANEREVKSRDLANDIPDLSQKLPDEQGRMFTYLGYVSGKILNESANSERTDFTLPERAAALFPDEISQELIRKTAIPYIQEYLSNYLCPVREEKLAKIKKFVYTEAPQFRPILKHKPDFLEQIPPNLEGAKLQIALSKLYYQADIEIKETFHELFSLKEIDQKNLSTLREKFLKYIDQINDFGKANLAQYIVHRKFILTLFEKLLERHVDDTRYSLEESIHKIIFPLQHTSDDIAYDQQNLWLIDERLNYHQYLASDKKLHTIEVLENDSEERLDLIVFNTPFAFMEGSRTDISSIVIIEFKRPARNAYSDEENPIDQVIRYVGSIKEGKAKDKSGRHIVIPENMPFYAYILCDLTPKIQQYARERDYTPAPDSQGYFSYHKAYKTYIEIISYDKLVNDAKKRNQVLFDKLSLPL